MTPKGRWSNGGSLHLDPRGVCAGSHRRRRRSGRREVGIVVTWACRGRHVDRCVGRVLRRGDPWLSRVLGSAAGWDERDAAIDGWDGGGLKPCGPRRLVRQLRFFHQRWPLHVQRWWQGSLQCRRAIRMPRALRLQRRALRCAGRVRASHLVRHAPWRYALQRADEWELCHLGECEPWQRCPQLRVPRLIRVRVRDELRLPQDELEWVRSRVERRLVCLRAPLLRFCGQHGDHRVVWLGDLVAVGG